MMRHLDLFSGIGGFALAASWVWKDEHHIHYFVEIDRFCHKVLKKHWPYTPIHDDIRTYIHDGTAIDLLTGGYPCQAFSTASHRRITSEDLSPIMLQVIEEVQPRCVIAENVDRKTIENFRRRMGHIGYNSSVYNIDAAVLGGDHKRSRWFCVAHPYNKSEFQSEVNAKMALLQSLQKDTWGYENYAGTIRVPNGVSNRMDRLKALGNAIVPIAVVPFMTAMRKAVL